MVLLSVNLETLLTFAHSADGAVGEQTEITTDLIALAGRVAGACAPGLQGDVSPVLALDTATADLNQLAALARTVHDEVLRADDDGDGAIQLSVFDLMWLHLRVLAGTPDDTTIDPTSTDEIGRVLDLYRAAGVDPVEYADLLQEYYVRLAYERAGIVDPGAWDPERGYDAMVPYLDAVYTYYADLYLEHPDLQWAGMAGMIGPSFAAGMADLGMFREGADRVSLPIDSLPGWMKGAVLALLPPGLGELHVIADLSEEEFAFYETSLLSMQKEIFHDQAPMHEAYLDGGVAAIEEMRAAGLVGPDMVDAWTRIDSGDPDQIRSGNHDLLYREQWEIIRDDYDDMRSRFPSGPAMTYLMGAIGHPSIPGANPLADVKPLEFTVEVESNPLVGPGVEAEVTVATPLPDGNVSSADTRWELIEQDTFPAYVDLIENDPDQARDILGTEFMDRLDDARLINSLDDIGAQLLDWDVDVAVHPTVELGPFSDINIGF